MTKYIPNVIAWFFGDYSFPTDTLADTAKTSFAVDCNHVVPQVTSVNFTITGSTSGNIEFYATPDGVNNQILTNTYPYAGDISINLREALNGFSPYMVVVVTDTSSTAGTLNAVMLGQTG